MATDGPWVGFYKTTYLRINKTRFYYKLSIEHYQYCVGKVWLQQLMVNV